MSEPQPMHESTGPIAYAIARDPSPTASSAWPLVLLVFLALGLIVLAGCFCIGLVLLVRPMLTDGGRNSGNEEFVFVAGILTLLAAACFLPGITLALLLARQLLRRI